MGFNLGFKGLMSFVFLSLKRRIGPTGLYLNGPRPVTLMKHAKLQEYLCFRHQAL